jgi:tRNA threonylcarbamoyladenosine modification (KEOPS) complex  Pcc1 subunit
VSRSITAEGAWLIISLSAADARALRAAACTLCDLAGVAARAVEVFGEGAE